MKTVPPLCLELPGKEVHMPRPDGGAVEIDWQLLSPVTTGLKPGLVLETKGVIMQQFHSNPFFSIYGTYSSGVQSCIDF